MTTAQINYLREEILTDPAYRAASNERACTSPGGYAADGTYRPGRCTASQPSPPGLPSSKPQVTPAASSNPGCGAGVHTKRHAGQDAPPQRRREP